MKRIIVTGATSMIGVALIKEAIRNKVEVYAIIRPNSNRLNRLPASKLVRVIECSIDGFSSINNTPNADVLYHFAWVGTDKENRDNPFLQEQNIKYSLDAVALANRCNCKLFIGAGSQAEYGRVNGKISEHTIERPFNSYGMVKLSANMLCKKACEQYSISFAWGRIFSVYGKNDNNNSMISYAIDMFASGKEAVFSSGSRMWNYLYEDDAGKIFYLLGEKESCGVYNVANWESLELIEYVQGVVDVFRNDLNFDVKYRVLKKENNNSLSINPDMTRLRGAIGHFEMVDFDKGIKEIVCYKKSRVLM